MSLPSRESYRDGLANHFGAAAFVGASEGFDGDSDFATDGGATRASAAATDAVVGRAIHAKSSSEPVPAATSAITSGQNRKPVRRLSTAAAGGTGAGGFVGASVSISA